MQQCASRFFFCAVANCLEKRNVSALNIFSVIPRLRWDTKLPFYLSHEIHKFLNISFCIRQEFFEILKEIVLIFPFRISRHERISPASLPSSHHRKDVCDLNFYFHLKCTHFPFEILASLALINHSGRDARCFSFVQEKIHRNKRRNSSRKKEHSVTSRSRWASLGDRLER